MCIDPLAEKYTYNSTYAFQENKMGLGRELEGLELYRTNPINFNSVANSVVPALKNFGNEMLNKFSKAADKVAEVAEDTDTYVKIGAVLTGIGSAMAGQPEGVAGAIEMYEAGETISKVSTVAKSASAVAKGNASEAAINLGAMAVDAKIGAKIDKIPTVSNVTKLTIKTNAGAILDKTKDKIIEKVKEVEKKTDKK